MTTPAGWYADPEVAGQQRWWDGAGWTANQAPLAPTPPTPVPSAAPTPPPYMAPTPTPAPFPVPAAPDPAYPLQSEPYAFTQPAFGSPGPGAGTSPQVPYSTSSYRSGDGGPVIAAWIFAFLVWPIGLILSLVSRSKGGRYVGPLVCSLIVGVLSIGFVVVSASQQQSVAASNQFAAAWNTMQAVNTSSGTALQSAINANDANAAAGAVSTDLAAHQKFDAAVLAISFPANAQVDAKAVLAADTVIETDLQNLNTSFTTNGSDFTTAGSQLGADQPKFTSAVKALDGDLGITVTTTPSG